MKKYNKIVAVFDKVIVKLESLVSDNRCKIGENTTKITELRTTNDNLNMEAERAAVTISNLKKLLGAE